MSAPILAHGGAAGALAEAIFLAVPVVAFLLLSRWSKRKARLLEEGDLEGKEEGTP